MDSSASEQLLAKTTRKLQREYDSLLSLLHGKHHSTNGALERNNGRGAIRSSAVAILPATWSRHSAYLLTATDASDPLFDILGEIAMFCQMRAGNGSPAGSPTRIRGEEDAASSTYPHGSDPDAHHQMEVIDQTMRAVEAVRVSLDDRCQLIRALIKVCDNVVTESLNASRTTAPSEEDGTPVALPTRMTATQNETQPDESHTHLEQQGLPPKVGGRRLPPSKRREELLKRERELEEAVARGGFDRPTNDSFTAANGSAMMGPTNGNVLAKYLRLKQQCERLLTEGKHNAVLFRVLDDVGLYCCAQGHTLDTVCIIPKGEAVASTFKQRQQQQAEGGPAHTTLREREEDGDASGSGTGVRTETQIVRLGNGMLATVMLEVPFDEVDVEAEARRVREVQEVVASLRELAELQELVRVETERQGLDLQQSERQTDSAYAFSVAARKQLVKAAKYKVIYITLAGGLLGAAIGGPIGLAVGAKSAAAIAGASAVGSVGTAIVANAAQKFGRPEIDEDYERERLQNKKR